MKTTVEIADSLLLEAKALSSRKGIPLRRLIEDGLRSVLAQQNASPQFKLEDGSVDGQGLITNLTPHEIILMTYEDRVQ